MPQPFQYQHLFQLLEQNRLSNWVTLLKSQVDAALMPAGNGHFDTWLNAFQQLPECPSAQLLANRDAVTLQGPLNPADAARIPMLLRSLHPWRKGPFQFFNTFIDTEWQSCLKWNRLAPHIDFHGRRILDVGCGNGYYGWRMLDAGAQLVLGLDPFLLYVMQFEFLRRYLPEQTPHFLLPLGDHAIPERLFAFDTCLSMGVLYHRTSPIDHLQTLWKTLEPGGLLILETLVLHNSSPEVLVPDGRYAKMRNVWFIPSLPMLLRWLQRCGFSDPVILDVSPTTTTEQRRTEWMTFESLPDFLDPNDPSRTVEGHPAPIRAIVTARRR